MRDSAVCCNCGAKLKFPITFQNKIYGSDCINKVFGITDIPSRFTGDYDEYKKKIEQEKLIKEQEVKDIQERIKKDREEGLKLAEKHFETRIILSSAWAYALNNQDSWARGFLNSIAKQLGGYDLHLDREYLECDTFEQFLEVEKRLNPNNQNYMTIVLNPKNNYRDINDLSEKQKTVLSRILDKIN